MNRLELEVTDEHRPILEFLYRKAFATHHTYLSPDTYEELRDMRFTMYNALQRFQKDNFYTWVWTPSKDEDLSFKEAIPMQVCRYGGNLHLQARGPGVNREYGVAADFVVRKEIEVPNAAPNPFADKFFQTWLQKQEPWKKSIASNDLKYLPVFFSRVGNMQDAALLLIEGTPYNHPDGAIMHVWRKGADVWECVFAFAEKYKGWKEKQKAADVEAWGDAPEDAESQEGSYLLEI